MCTERSAACLNPIDENANDTIPLDGGSGRMARSMVAQARVGSGAWRFGAMRQRFRPVICTVSVSTGSKCARVLAPGWSQKRLHSRLFLGTHSERAIDSRMGANSGGSLTYIVVPPW